MKKEEIRVDYHFHPNLPKNSARGSRKANQVYKKFRDFGIRAVIVTEHVYKDYIRAWEIMKKHRTDDILIFPGIEYTTKENIDVCLFSETEEIYRHKFTPFQKTYEEMVDFIEREPKIFGFVTHPFTLGRTSIVRKKGEEFTKKMINKLGAVEAHYTVFSELKTTLQKLGLSKAMTSLMDKINRNENLPKEFYPQKINFLAGGSDAHHTWEIGTHLKVSLQNDDIFYSITNNTKLKKAGERKSSAPQKLLSLSTTFQEACLKILVRIRRWN